jgi:hypothetical protein
LGYEAAVAVRPSAIVMDPGAERQLRMLIRELDMVALRQRRYRRFLLATARLRLLDIGEVCAEVPGDFTTHVAPGAIGND